ncbi:MAG: hypothetical protein JNL83_06170 [Myxococcales bacterium]|nr:hypothetical protein [Myxococcales bacterium]
MKGLALLLLLVGCGDDASRPVDAAPTGDSADPDGPGDVPRCDPPATFAAGLTPLRTLHVSPSGSAGGDGSPASPFATIEQAAAAATPGTAILLAPGTHQADQFVAALRGTATAPIWIGGAPGAAKPVISGGAQALQLARPAYVVVHDLEIASATANGLNIDDGGMFSDETAAHHVVVERVDIHDVGTTGGNNDCLKVSGVNQLAVLDSRFANCGGGGSGIDHVGCHGSTIARNVFSGRMENAVQSKGGARDHDLRANRVAITGSRAFNLGGSTDLNLFRPPLSTTAPNAEARRIRAFDNVITGLGPTATPFAFVGCIDCLAAHNYVRGQQRWHVRVLQETATQSGFTFEPAANGRVINNTFVFSAASLATAVNVGAGTSAGTFTFRTNLWYASDTPASSAPMNLPSAETGGVSGMPSGYVNIPDDPLASLAGPQIATGSAEWAARPARLPEVPGTMAGLCRGDPTTIGPGEAESGTL